MVAGIGEAEVFLIGSVHDDRGRSDVVKVWTWGEMSMLRSESKASLEMLCAFALGRALGRNVCANGRAFTSWVPPYERDAAVGRCLEDDGRSEYGGGRSDGRWGRVGRCRFGHGLLHGNVPDRPFVTPEHLDRSSRLPALVTGTPERRIGSWYGAKELEAEFLSLCTMYSIRVQLARVSHDAAAGAEYCVGSWNLGQFSTVLLMWDLLWVAPQGEAAHARTSEGAKIERSGSSCPGVQGSVRCKSGGKLERQGGAGPQELCKSGRCSHFLGP